jgi:DNA-binding transcriptional MerR regulator
VKINIGEAMLFVAGMIALAAFFWRELFPDDEVYDKRWLLAWMGKGALLPILVWVALNSGRQPMMPALILVKHPAAKGWFSALAYAVNYVCAQTGPALFVIGSYWAALTIGWLVWASASRAELRDLDRRDFVVSALLWCGLLSPVVALMLYVYGLKVIGLALLIWVCPLAQHALSLKPVKTQPSYAHAIASLKFGKYHQAEKAIIGELEKCETDFDGWLMLAELYAKQFHDLAGAERTVHGLCDEPATTPAQAAVALNKLADWQLQFRNDPAAARRALREIVRRGPGTHLARMAELRMNQLPATSAEWQEQHRARTVHLPPLGDQLDAAPDPSRPQISEHKALDLANQCVEKLKENPADAPTREKLAHIFAEQLGKTGPAIEQIEQLMEMPNQPPEKKAGWLALIAAWEIRRGGDRQAARKRLEQLLREHPKSVQALAARRRLELLDQEEHAAKTGQLPPSPDSPRLTIDGAV